MGFESKQPKKISFGLKDTGLLSTPIIAKLIKANIRTPEELYWSIQKETQKVSEIIGIDIDNTYALGTFLLDWIDKDSLKYWAHLSLVKTGSPIKLDYQQKFKIIIRGNDV
jgi:hypothetical protein